MKIDPRTKLLILAITSISVFLNGSITIECIFAALPFLLLLSTKKIYTSLKYAAYAISHTSTPQADVELPLTEIHEGDLYFCLEERKVSVRGKKVDLSAREFNTLYLLLML